MKSRLCHVGTSSASEFRLLDISFYMTIHDQASVYFDNGTEEHPKSQMFFGSLYLR
jgi:hypothetical protein